MSKKSKMRTFEPCDVFHNDCERFHTAFVQKSESTYKHPSTARYDDCPVQRCVLAFRMDVRSGWLVCVFELVCVRPLAWLYLRQCCSHSRGRHRLRTIRL